MKIRFIRRAVPTLMAFAFPARAQQHTLRCGNWRPEAAARPAMNAK